MNPVAFDFSAIKLGAMLSVPWMRFSWDLAQIPSEFPFLESHYHLRPATREEVKPIHHLVLTAFSLDAEWSDTLRGVQEKFEAELEEVFGDGDSCGLVLTHGNRIIGASVLNRGAEAESHLLSGPAILMEYRNRGFGTALLCASLQSLRHQGLATARGITKANSSAAKGVYPKFGSVAEACQFEPALLAS